MTGRSGASITGLGVVSGAGLGPRALYEACRAGRSIVTPDSEYGWPTGRIAEETMVALREALAASPLARRILAGQSLEDRGLAKSLLMTIYTLVAALEPGPDLALGPDTGLIFATTTGHMALWEQELPRFVTGELSPQAFAPTFREYHLARSLDPLWSTLAFPGPMQVITSACAAGSQALVLALKWLQTGKVKRCLVGATETLTLLTTRGFGSFNLLSPETARPFDRQRAGINLGEASVFLCLEANPSRPARAVVLGGATALDAFDMTRPHPEGRGIHRAMTRALAEAGRVPGAVDWVYAHGTGTVANDQAESTAIRMLFGGEGPPVSSTKAVHGHTLAASGLLETALLVEALAEDLILPSANLREPDPELGLNLATRAVVGRLGTVLKTTLGFGGVNAALVLGKGEAPWRF